MKLGKGVVSVDPDRVGVSDMLSSHLRKILLLNVQTLLYG